MASRHDVRLLALSPTSSGVGRTVNASALTRYSVADSGCWQWTGPIDPLGYGKVTVRLADGRRSSTNAHRVFYEGLVGPIPAGLQLDHLCRNPSCVNPAHLEPVTNGENVWRAIQATRPCCPKGHPFTPENTWHDGLARRCRTCRRERDAAYKRRWRAENKGRVAEVNRAYYLANREALIERERERKAARKRRKAGH